MPDIATCKNGAFLAPLEFDPGDRWQYGISMDWIGKLVEAVSDQSLEVYFRENIFAPYIAAENARNTADASLPIAHSSQLT
jgi:CubicO group peptidase (beta-lactamase class C family)